MECIHAAAGTADGTTKLYHHQDAVGWFRRLFANENAEEGHSTMAAKSNVDTRSFETVPVVDLSRFLRNAARTVKEGGLSADVALAALTSEAAKIAGVDNRLGTLQRNRIANLVVTAVAVWALG